MVNHEYSLRTSKINYRELTSVKLPKARKTSSKDTLYPIEVVEMCVNYILIIGHSILQHTRDTICALIRMVSYTSP